MVKQGDRGGVVGAESRGWRVEGGGGAESLLGYMLQKRVSEAPEGASGAPPGSLHRPISTDMEEVTCCMVTRHTHTHMHKHTHTHTHTHLICLY